jgi:hypothetical protein
MLFYRVGHITETNFAGIPYGPYSSDNNSCFEMIVAHNDSENHPHPQIDGLNLFIMWYCGSISYEGLNEWFEGWHEKLHELGFVLYTYEVDDYDVQVGNYQSIARLESESTTMVD